jgi:hypothetical protein
MGAPPSFVLLCNRLVCVLRFTIFLCKSCPCCLQLNITAQRVLVRDLYLHEDLGVYTNEICMVVNPTGVRMLKVTPEKSEV